MKKKVLLFLCVSLLLGVLTACGAGDETAETPWRLVPLSTETRAAEIPAALLDGALWEDADFGFAYDADAAAETKEAGRLLFFRTWAYRKSEGMSRFDPDRGTYYYFYLLSPSESESRPEFRPVDGEKAQLLVWEDGSYRLEGFVIGQAGDPNVPAEEWIAAVKNALPDETAIDFARWGEPTLDPALNRLCWHGVCGDYPTDDGVTVQWNDAGEITLLEVRAPFEITAGETWLAAPERLRDAVEEAYRTTGWKTDSVQIAGVTVKKTSLGAALSVTISVSRPNREETRLAFLIPEKG